MFKESDGPNSPADLREVLRVSCLRSFEPLRLVRGSEVWVLEGGHWEVAVVGSRLPGDVYRGQIDGRTRKNGYVIISRNVYGGPVCD